MAEQTLQLSAAWLSAFQNGLIFWTPPNADREQIVAGLTPPAAERWFSSLEVTGAGQISLYFSSSQTGGLGEGGDDLTDLFETDGQIAITVGGTEYVFSLNSADLTETYAWTPSNLVDTAAISAAAVAAGTGNLAATLIIRDFVPVAPSAGDATAGAWAFAGQAATGSTVAPDATGDATAGSWSFAGEAATGTAGAPPSPDDATGDATAGAWAFAGQAATGSTATPTPFTGDATAGAWAFAGQAATGTAGPPSGIPSRFDNLPNAALAPGLLMPGFKKLEVLLDITAPDGTVYKWLDGPASRDGYTTDHPVESITPPRMVSTTTRVLMEVTLADSDLAWFNRLAPDAGMGLLTVRLSVNGTDAADSLVLFRGRCVEVSADRKLRTHASYGSGLTQITAQRLMIASDADQRRRDPDDNALAFVHRADSIPWGRSV